jgi:hypothetical protein
LQGESGGFSPAKSIKEECDDKTDEILELSSSVVYDVTNPRTSSPTSVLLDMPVLQHRAPETTRHDTKQFVSLPSTSDSDSDCVTATSYVGLPTIQPATHSNDVPILISSDSSEDTKQIPSISDTTVEVYAGNHKLPIFSKSITALTSCEVFRLCFGEFDEQYLCRTKPVSVRQNSTFLVDMNNIDMRSLYADDNGVWKMSTPRKYYRVSMKDGKVGEVVAGNKNSYSHYLKRQYGKHQATYEEAGVTFQRIISTVYDRNEQWYRYTVVQYIHRDGDEGDIVVRPHGNSKNKKRPFFKTSPDVLQYIKEEPLSAKPRRVFKELIDVAGGPLYSSSSSSEPRNLQQIYNVRKTKRTDDKADDFTHLLSQVKESSFVHDLTIDSDSVQYTLAMERQLRDVELLCTHPIKFCFLHSLHL